MSALTNAPSPLQGTLSLFQTEPVSLPVFETRPDLPNKLVFVPGLTDTIGVVPYLSKLAAAVEKLNYSLVQPMLASNLGGFGTSSLEGDAQEIAQLLEHLLTRTEGACTGRLVLMGHSTGCQDTMAFLSQERKLPSGTPIKVHGGILQAPVSDCEHFEATESENSEGRQRLGQAKDLVESGQSSALLPRSAREKPVSSDGRGLGNAEAVLNPAFTAYRFQSLNARGGDDDFFISNLQEEAMRKAWKPALSHAPLLALMGEKEYVYAASERGTDRAASLCPPTSTG